jgi:ribosome-associated protein
MQPMVRQYYNLEEIWGGKPVRVKLLPQSTQPVIAESYPAFDDTDED